MNDPFNDKNAGVSAPDMLLEAGSSNNQFNPEDYIYRVTRFEMGGQDTNDESAAFEALLNRSLTPDVMIIERKDSISATTGVYTCIIIYLERRVQPPGGPHA